MEKFPRSLSVKMQQRQEQNAVRALSGSNGLVDFASNDYLGYSSSREIFDAAHEYLLGEGVIQNGATGSRLISGNHNLYSEAETLIADFHHAESALIYNSGYDANVGFFSAVPQRGDVVLYDEYVHASIRDGIRLSYAQAYKFAHNDSESLSGQLKNLGERLQGGEIYIVTESVFSMDGDSPDLGEMAHLAEKYNALLVVDEAHALGVFGMRGEGLVQGLGLKEKVFARVVTFGKALGCHGAAVVGSQQLRDYLVNFSRSFIYTTALPPHSVATICCAYRQLQSDDEARGALKANISHFTKEAHRLGLAGFVPANSAIQCIIIPGNTKTRDIAVAIRAKGYDVKPILSPTVPQGKERLRFCLHSYNSKEEISSMLSVLMTLL